MYKKKIIMATVTTTTAAVSIPMTLPAMVDVGETAASGVTKQGIRDWLVTSHVPRSSLAQIWYGTMNLQELS